MEVGHKEVTFMILTMNSHVSILVVMEVGHKVDLYTCYLGCPCPVSILVVMEVGHKVAIGILLSQADFLCFNPCCHGSWS